MSVQALRTALEDIVHVLGTGACSENTCSGCAYEVTEAVAIAQAALVATPPLPTLRRMSDEEFAVKAATR